MGVATAALNEAQLGEYGRKRGVYPEEIKAWRLACERANDGGAVQRSPGRGSGASGQGADSGPGGGATG